MGMMDDNGKIEGIWWEPDGAMSVGMQCITKIECYREPGQCAHVPWFKVWEGDNLKHRINGAMIGGVTYFPPKTGETS